MHSIALAVFSYRVAMRRNCFEAIGAPFDEIAPLVGFPIVFYWRLAVRSWRDDGFDASPGQVVANAVAVVALVTDELGGIDRMQRHQRVITFDLVRLVEAQRIAFAVC